MFKFDILSQMFTFMSNDRQIQIQKLYLTSSFTIKNTSIAAIARHGDHVGMRCVMD